MSHISLQAERLSAGSIEANANVIFNTVTLLTGNIGYDSATGIAGKKTLVSLPASFNRTITPGNSRNLFAKLYKTLQLRFCQPIFDNGHRFIPELF